MPTSRAASRPTRHADGPTVAIRPPPSGPPDRALRSATTAPVSAPVTKPHIGAPSDTGAGRERIVRTPPTAPATNGAARASSETAGAGPGSGSAASGGKAGTASRNTPAGDTLVPAPTEKPGPTAYATPQITAFGRNASSTSSRRTPPTTPGARRSYRWSAADMFIASDAPTSTAPDASSTDSAPATPITSERGRSGSSRSSAPSPDRARGPRAAAATCAATTARAAPRPPGTTATRNPATTACHADGRTSGDDAASASSPASPAYGAASASATCTTARRG